LLIVGLLLIEHLLHRRQARRMGYRSWGQYLRSVPKNDAEKRDAVDWTARGIVLCGLGVLFPPLLILGLFPLYRGVRKLGLLLAGVSPAPLAGPDSETGKPQG
jgi:hypothetical protein